MKVDDVFNKIIQKNKVSNIHEYQEYLHKVYGGLFLEDVKNYVCNQLIEFEVARLDSALNFKPKEIRTPEELLKEYCAISFEMAQMTHSKRISCVDLAHECEKMFNEFISSGILDKTQPILKRIISETILDLKYAGGKQNISSIRMAQIIKSRKEK